MVPTPMCVRPEVLVGSIVIRAKLIAVGLNVHCGDRSVAFARSGNGEKLVNRHISPLTPIFGFPVRTP